MTARPAVARYERCASTAWVVVRRARAEGRQDVLEVGEAVGRLVGEAAAAGRRLG